MGREFVTMHQLREALAHAAKDPALAAVMVEVAGVACGMASAQELHDLLAAVGRGGKRTIAVLDSEAAEPREYLIGAGAREIVANADTTLMMLGASAGGFFVKRALASAHIEAQTLQWKEYKGAGEITSREHMSAEVRESLEAVVDDWQRMLVDYVARARRLDPVRAAQLINGGFLSARMGQEAGLIDRLGHVQDVLADFEAEDEGEERPPLIARLMRRTRREQQRRRGNRIVDLHRYLRRTSYLEDKGRRPRIGLVYGLGPVIAGEPPRGGEYISGQQTAAELMLAARDPRVRAVVFRVNSPGGSAVGSDLVWRAVTEVQRRGKPVVVSMGDVAGSGGYYVAMGADAIVAEPATITGSIGVVYTKFALNKLLGQLGIATDFAKTDEVSDALSFARPMSERELAQLNDVVGELYGNFTAKVAEGRKLDPARAEELARGRVWSGVAAQARGLVDELGGLGRAIELARVKAGLAPGEAHDLVRYPAPRLLSAVNFAFSRSEISAELPWIATAGASAVGIPARWIPATVRLAARGGLMLICPLIQ